MTKKILQSNIAEIRKAKGRTQREMATALNTTETTVRNWEKGRTALEYFALVADVCDFLECSPRELVSIFFVEEAEEDLEKKNTIAA